MDRAPLLRRPLPDRPQRRRPSRARPDRRRGPTSDLEILFVGRAEGRKGLPVLLRAFEALRAAGVDARLTVAGATERGGGAAAARRRGRGDRRPRVRGGEVAPARRGGPALRAVAGRRELRHGPDRGVRVRHARGGVDIAGYRDVVRDRLDGLLVPAGDAVELGEALRDLALDPARRRAWPARPASAPSASPGRRWREVMEVYEEALARPQPEGRAARVAARAGVAARRARRRAPGPQRLASLEPKDRRRAGRSRPRAWRAAALVAVGAAGGIGLAALALERIGLEPIGRALLAATPIWVLVGLRAHVRLDAAARGGLARDPARRPARHARAPARHRARDDDRRARCRPRCRRGSASRRAR